ncbi:hypothetical protein PanWU01x14_051110 [Parasponia andersonii]|uniref:Uncharacterized protein n=1 Tax=Parasponia andersonii TaxID=3476 RepID=A0A2P5DLV7_PARAD|nr:hypothetical protein PanWU01x14_051110 [Parasponia andersonii]
MWVVEINMSNSSCPVFTTYSPPSTTVASFPRRKPRVPISIFKTIFEVEKSFSIRL